MAKATIHIYLDKECIRCGSKDGATQNGLCLACITKGVRDGEYDHILKPLRNKIRRQLKK